MNTQIKRSPIELKMGKINTERTQEQMVKSHQQQYTHNQGIYYEEI